MKTSTPDSTPAPTATSKASKAAQRQPEAVKSFQPKGALKPHDLRAVFDDTCARYPKTLARLAE